MTGIACARPRGAYLDKEYGSDGRMSDWSYAYAVRLLKSLGFTDLNELDKFLSGFNDDQDQPHAARITARAINALRRCTFDKLRNRIPAPPSLGK